MSNTASITLSVAGFGRSGKDTVATLLRKMVKPSTDVRIYKFADKLREEVRDMGICPDVDPWTEDPELKKIIRPYLIEVGAGRRKDDPRYWISALEKPLMADRKPGIRIITDVRYLNEADWVMGLGGIVLLLHRKGNGPVSDEEAEQTAKLYDNTNPLWFKPNFRPFWWTHDLYSDSVIPKAERWGHEMASIEASIPELAPFLL